MHLGIGALNELFLGLEVYLAHGANGTIVPGEWLPIYYGLSGGLLLILAGLLATRHRTAASVIATAALVGSALIGFLGVYFHLARAVLPTAPAGEPSPASTIAARRSGSELPETDLPFTR